MTEIADLVTTPFPFQSPFGPPPTRSSAGPSSVLRVRGPLGHFLAVDDNGRPKLLEMLLAAFYVLGCCSLRRLFGFGACCALEFDKDTIA